MSWRSVFENPTAQHERVSKEYTDPSAAHEEALRLQMRGAYRVQITPKRGKYIVEAWFRAENPAEIAKVELYNIVRHGRAVGNGYWVTRYVGGHMPEHRRERLKDFGTDRDAAYAYAERWNKGLTR